MHHLVRVAETGLARTGNASIAVVQDAVRSRRRQRILDLDGGLDMAVRLHYCASCAVGVASLWAKSVHDNVVVGDFETTAGRE